MIIPLSSLVSLSRLSSRLLYLPLPPLSLQKEKSDYNYLIIIWWPNVDHSAPFLHIINIINININY